jgi:hypothetical protein
LKFYPAGISAMLQLVNFVLNLFILLPWWGAVAVLVGLAAGLWLGTKYLVHRMFQDVCKAVANEGAGLAEATTQVHSVESTATPTHRSAFDADPEDEDFDPELDGNWTDEDGAYFQVDATITPRNPETTWDPSVLSLVSADFAPRDQLEATDRMALLHSVQVFRNGRFVDFAEGLLRGPQRLKMLFAAAPDLRDVKFSYHFTRFGRLTLPANPLQPATQR